MVQRSLRPKIGFLNRDKPFVRFSKKDIKLLELEMKEVTTDIIETKRIRDSEHLHAKSQKI